MRYNNFQYFFIGFNYGQLLVIIIFLYLYLFFIWICARLVVTLSPKNEIKHQKNQL